MLLSLRMLWRLVNRELISRSAISSTFGNELEPTSNWLEVIFSICVVLSGLLLFTLLAGNIQVL